jgi:hypothetical protein
VEQLGGGRSGAATHNEEVGEGPDPTDRRRATGDGPAMTRMVGAKTGDGESLASGPEAIVVGRQC